MQNTGLYQEFQIKVGENIRIKCRYSTGGLEAVEGKQQFEQLVVTHRIKIKAYRADNSIIIRTE